MDEQQWAWVQAAGPWLVAGLVLALLVIVAVLLAVTTRVVKQGVDAAARVGTHTVDATERSVAHLANATAGVVAPLTEGTGQVLSAIADRVRVKQHQLNELAAQNVALAQEVERLRTRHIDVTEITAQLKLGLIEVAQQTYSFRRQQLAVGGGGAFSSATSTEYLGLQRAEYRSQIGVDLERLRFARMADDVILVHGLREISVLGLSAFRLEKLVDEVRQLTLDATGKAKSAEILLKDDRREEMRQRHHDDLVASIQNPASVSHFAGAVAKFGLAFLQACLGAGGYRVVEAPEPLDDGLTFLDLCQAINQELAAQIEHAQTRRAAVERSSRELQSEVVALVSRG